MCQQHLVVATTKPLNVSPLRIEAKTVGIDDEMIAGHFGKYPEPMFRASHDTGIDYVGWHMCAIGRLNEEVGRGGYAGQSRVGSVADTFVERPVRRLTAARAVGCGFAASTLVWREGL